MSNGVIHIALPAGQDAEAMVCIFNLSCAEVFRSACTESCGLSPAGVYLATVKANAKYKVAKITVQ